MNRSWQPEQSEGVLRVRKNRQISGVCEFSQIALPFSSSVPQHEDKVFSGIVPKYFSNLVTGTVARDFWYYELPKRLTSFAAVVISARLLSHRWTQISTDVMRKSVFICGSNSSRCGHRPALMRSSPSFEECALMSCVRMIPLLVSGSYFETVP
jgi:hypothetical protein